jgi:hypothetical protein
MFVVRLACALLLAAAGTSPASSAGNPANGQSLYQTWCSGCHGSASNNLSSVLNGANNSSLLLLAWGTYSPMQFLQTAFPSETQAADDVAAYLGTVASTMRVLQVPVSLSLGSQVVGAQSTPTAITLSSVGGFAVTITSMVSSDPKQFPIVGSTCSGTITAGASCQVDVAFSPSTVGDQSGAITILSNGAGNPQSITIDATGTASNVPPVNYQGLWWKSPAGSESGWGINFAHQGDVIFATWFTYDATGKAWWLSMTANKSSDKVYAGTLFQTAGPPFDAVPFDPTQVTGVAVGVGTLTFADPNNGSFTYMVNGVTQVKALTREVFGPLPTCTFGAQSNRSLATNYQDLWWASPPGSESGWGINLTQEGDVIFATWFTYDHDRTPLWLIVTAPKTGPGIYSGSLLRTTGPAFNAVPFDPMKVVGTAVGTASFIFSDGNTASFAYTVNGVAQAKPITREVFRSPGTLCQ